jgi:hypothetical protein
MPFSLGGSLLPGATQRYTTADGSLVNGTLQIAATKAVFAFQDVNIVE